MADSKSEIEWMDYALVLGLIALAGVIGYYKGEKAGARAAPEYAAALRESDKIFMDLLDQNCPE